MVIRLVCCAVMCVEDMRKNHALFLSAASIVQVYSSEIQNIYYQDAEH